MIKKCVVLNGKVINLGEWNNQEGSNPMPDGAIEGNFDISYTSDNRIVLSNNYYELRYSEYPYIGDQLDSMWKGLKSLNIENIEFQNMLSKIEEIKNKYPKTTQ